MAMNVNLSKSKFAYTMGRIISCTPIVGTVDQRTGEMLPDLLAVAVRDANHSGTSTLWVQVKLNENGQPSALDPELDGLDWSNGAEITAAGRVQNKGGIRVIKAVMEG